MTWISPRTWTTGEVVTSSMMNSLRDNLNELWKGTTAGDIEYYSASNQKERLGIGAEASVLTVASGIPTWAGALFCDVRFTGTQSLTSGVETAITEFDTEYYDWYNMHEGTDNFVTIPTAGFYIVTVYAQFQAHATADTLRQIGIFRTVSGSDYPIARNDASQSSGTVPTNINIADISNYGAGDLVKVYVKQNSGGALNISDIKLKVARVR